MKLRYKIGGGFALILAISILSMVVVLSHDSACGPAPGIPSGAETMSAIVYRCYGSTDVLKLEEIEKPVPADDEVLVKIRSASVNPLDWHYMRGTPYLLRLMSGVGTPHETGLGVDFAGTVEAVGSSVERFKTGDAVFGGGDRVFAEYITISEDAALVVKPAEVSFEQAAAVPIAGITALQALRDLGKLEPGQTVLINGASGGVGTFAVQIAKSFGAEVTGVCSTRNVEMVLSIGADHVFDYTQEDYTESGKKYDLIVDMVGNHTPAENRRALKPKGVFVIVGGGKGNWLGPMMAPAKALLMSPFIEQEFIMILAELRQDDLTVIGELMQAGKVTAIIDSRFRLSEISAAIRHSEEGHARGKIMIALE